MTIKLNLKFISENYKKKQIHFDLFLNKFFFISDFYFFDDVIALNQKEH